MKNFRVVVNGMEYEVGIEEILDGATPVVKAPVRAAAPKPTPVKAAAPKPAAPKAAPMAEGDNVISAPMPGTVLAVNKSAGDTVAKGDVLLVLEAMKMENEIMAPCDGTIANIHVASGASVNAGDVLVEIS